MYNRSLHHISEHQYGNTERVIFAKHISVEKDLKTYGQEPGSGADRGLVPEADVLPP